MPSASVPRASSAALHSIPSDRWPRMTPASNTAPSGITVPGRATAASMPASALGAPQTIGTMPLAGVDPADREPLGGGVRIHAEDAPDPHRVEEAKAVIHRIDRQPHQGQGFGQLGGAQS